MKLYGNETNAQVVFPCDFSKYDKGKIYFYGENHTSPHFKDLKKLLRLNAKEDKIIFADESFGINADINREYKNYYINPNVRKIEGNFIRLYSNLAREYFEAKNQDIEIVKLPDIGSSVQFRFFADIASKPFVKRAWTNFRQNVSFQENSNEVRMLILGDQVLQKGMKPFKDIEGSKLLEDSTALENVILSFLKYINAIMIRRKILKDNSLFKNFKKVDYIFNDLQLLIDKEGPDDQNSLKEKKKYFYHQKNALSKQFVNLRNEFMAQNIAKVYCDSLNRGIELRVLMGDNHIKGVTALLAKTAGDRIQLIESVRASKDPDHKILLQNDLKAIKKELESWPDHLKESNLIKDLLSIKLNQSEDDFDNSVIKDELLKKYYKRMYFLNKSESSLYDLQKRAISIDQESLLTFLKKVEDTNEQSNNGHNVLDFVSFFFDVPGALETLIKKEKNINKLNSLGETTLMAAAQGGASKAVLTLIENGADDQITNNDGQNLLALASYGKIKVILNNILNSNSKDKIEKAKLLRAFLEKYNSEFLELKLEQDSKGKRILKGISNKGVTQNKSNWDNQALKLLDELVNHPNNRSDDQFEFLISLLTQDPTNRVKDSNKVNVTVEGRKQIKNYQDIRAIIDKDKNTLNRLKGDFLKAKIEHDITQAVNKLNRGPTKNELTECLANSQCILKGNLSGLVSNYLYSISSSFDNNIKEDEKVKQIESQSYCEWRDLIKGCEDKELLKKIRQKRKELGLYRCLGENEVEEERHILYRQQQREQERTQRKSQFKALMNKLKDEFNNSSTNNPNPDILDQLVKLSWDKWNLEYQTYLSKDIALRKKEKLAIIKEFVTAEQFQQIKQNNDAYEMNIYLDKIRAADGEAKTMLEVSDKRLEDRAIKRKQAFEELTSWRDQFIQQLEKLKSEKAQFLPREFLTKLEDSTQKLKDIQVKEDNWRSSTKKRRVQKINEYQQKLKDIKIDVNNIYQ